MRIHRTAKGGEQIGVRDEVWAHEHRRASDDGAAIELYALELVVVDDESRDCAVDDADATGGQAFALLGAEGVGVGEQGDVGRPCRTSSACWTASGVPPSTPRGWSRTS
jgi:hypothetical protein